MCFRYQWRSREGAGLIITHTWGVLYVMILGCDVMDCYVIQWHFYNNYEWKCVFKMWKIVLKFTSLQVGIRALVWGIRVHLRAYLNSNWGFEENFDNKISFRKKNLRDKQSRVVCTNSQRPNGDFPKYHYYKCYEIWCDMLYDELWYAC